MKARSYLREDRVLLMDARPSRYAPSGLSAAIDPYGAQLVSMKTAEGTELIWQGDPRMAGPRPHTVPPDQPDARRPHSLRGRDYPMPPHGFATSWIHGPPETESS